MRNAGIHKASYPLVIAIDADCFLPPDAIVKSWEFMRDEKYIGAALGVRFLSDKHLHRVVAFLIQGLVASLSGIYGAMFVFRRDAALAIGGFPEDRLVAEDTAFAIAMRKLAARSGKEFGLLRTVQVGTLDRKRVGLSALPSLVLQVTRAFAGAKQKPSDLKYWYEPDR